MNPLVKKEIRLLLPAWSVALLLALVQAIARPYDFYVAALLFFGMTVMALTSFGRETSLNTFSQMLAQPMERLRHWQTKLSVLAVAFLTIFGVWLLAFGFAFWNSTMATDNVGDSRNLFITVCLIATATFTGGLWTALLLRQLAAAFWLTLLVPATLSGFTAAFVSPGQSDNGVIAVICVILGFYSIGGFLFARWLFFRAQDVGWSGGVITLPQWRFLTARSESVGLIRRRKSIFALLKKEMGLQQTALIGAAGLLVLHTGVIALRLATNNKTGSWAQGLGLAGEIFTSIFWMLWLVMPVIVGCMAIAEERKQGVMEGQLCLPASRRIQFAIKMLITLLVGTFLGGVMPMLLEIIGNAIGAQNPAFTSDNHTNAFGSFLLLSGVPAFCAWLALVSFFASSLARNFLQAAGIAIVTFIGCVMLIPAIVNGRIPFYSRSPVAHPVLTLFVAVPTITVALIWLAYFNFKNFRDGWPLWRRNLLGLAGAVVFITASSSAIYNRAWEIFEPAELPHGPAKFFPSAAPELKCDVFGNLLVQISGGRVWFDSIKASYPDENQPNRWEILWWRLIRPLPQNAGPEQFIAGSNWVSATAGRFDWWKDIAGTIPSNVVHMTGYLDTIGVKSDGMLWISSESKPEIWTGGRMVPFGSETNWQQVARLSDEEILLLKADGTLWRWGTNRLDWNQWQTNWPTVRTFKPRQIGTNSDWKEIGSGEWWNGYARKTDNSVWAVTEVWKTGKFELQRQTNLDQVVFQSLAQSGQGTEAYVGRDRTLQVCNSYAYRTNGQWFSSGFLRVGTETNWVTVALTGRWLVALKSDGTLWKWEWPFPKSITDMVQIQPARLGIHNDWVAIGSSFGGIVSLAADGGLWFWPSPDYYMEAHGTAAYMMVLTKPPKQPELLGNIFQGTN